MLNQRVQVIFQYLGAPYKGLPTALFIHNSVIKAVMGMQEVKEAVAPGGVIAVYLDDRGQFSFETMLGHVEPEKGVS